MLNFLFVQVFLIWITIFISVECLNYPMLGPECWFIPAQWSDGGVVDATSTHFYETN